MLNPLAILKGAKVFLIIGAAIFLTSTLKTCEKNRVAERDAAITANAEKVSAQANAAALATANAQLEAIATATAAALVAAAEARVAIDDRFIEIQKTQQEQKAILEDSRLDKLISGRKKSLVLLRVNKATRERFDEVEAIFDGTEYVPTIPTSDPYADPRAVCTGWMW